MTKPLRVLHLVGSATNRFYCDLSELYARDCIQATADPARYTFLIAYVTPDRNWRFPDSLHPADIAAAEAMPLPEAVNFLAQQTLDVALPQMFCLPGMTEYRALLNVLQIPYVGNGPFQMAIAADKTKAKAIVSAAGVKVPKGELLQKGEFPSLLPPVVVKPNNSDNSDGVTLVRTKEEYPAALETAFAYAEQVIVEEFIELGREVRCGLIVQNGELVCLPLEEYFVDPSLRPIRTGAHKLKRDTNNTLTLTAKERTQAWIVEADDPVIPAVWEAAKRCHQAIGCEQYSLFDFRIDPQGQPWFIEAGLYCSFSPKSVVVTMMAAAGMPLNTFFETVLRQTAEKQTGRTIEEQQPDALLV